MIILGIIIFIIICMCVSGKMSEEEKQKLWDEDEEWEDMFGDW